MKKEELLKCCREAMKTEETANSIYMKHLSAIVLRSGLPKSEIQRIKDVIEFLISTNTRHKNMLESIVQRIMEEDIDVY